MYVVCFDKKYNNKPSTIYQLYRFVFICLVGVCLCVFIRYSIDHHEHFSKLNMLQICIFLINVVLVHDLFIYEFLEIAKMSFWIVLGSYACLQNDNKGLYGHYKSNLFKVQLQLY